VSLLDARRERALRDGVVPVKPDVPSFIDLAGANAAMAVMVTRGRVYGYDLEQYSPAQTAAIDRGLAGHMQGKQPGQVYNTYVKPQNRLEVQTCPRCGAVYAAKGHRCVVPESQRRWPEDPESRLEQARRISAGLWLAALDQH
jgi:hypothetical protein